MKVHRSPSSKLTNQGVTKSVCFVTSLNGWQVLSRTANCQSKCYKNPVCHLAPLFKSISCQFLSNHFLSSSEKSDKDKSSSFSQAGLGNVLSNIFLFKLLSVHFSEVTSVDGLNVLAQYIFLLELLSDNSSGWLSSLAYAWSWDPDHHISGIQNTRILLSEVGQ